MRGHERELLEAVLPAYLQGVRWFRGKARQIASAEVVRAVPVPVGSRDVLLTLVEVRYLDADAETTSCRSPTPRVIAPAISPSARPMRFCSPARAGACCTTPWRTRSSSTRWWTGMGRKKHWRAGAARWWAAAPAPTPSSAARTRPSEPRSCAASRPTPRSTWATGCCSSCSARPSRASIPIWSWDATSPTRPISAGCLCWRAGLELRTRNGEPITLGVLHQFVPSEGDAWTFTLNALSRFFERALVSSDPAELRPSAPLGIDRAGRPVAAPRSWRRRQAATWRRPACWASARRSFTSPSRAARDNAAFIPEAFTGLYRRSIYQSLRSNARTTFDLLRRRLPTLPGARCGRRPGRCSRWRTSLLRQARGVMDRKFPMSRFRIHGDYHLGQVLFTGKDFVIVDLEGEPSRSLSERRFKRSPMRDLAGMIRSFEYAAAYAVRHGPMRIEDDARPAPMGPALAAVGLGQLPRGYFDGAGEAKFLPQGPSAFAAMLDFYLLDKAIYELRYELNNRPDWVGIPLEGICAVSIPMRSAPVGERPMKPGRRPSRRAAADPWSSPGSSPAGIRSAPPARGHPVPEGRRSCGPTTPRRPWPSAGGGRAAGRDGAARGARDVRGPP